MPTGGRRRNMKVFPTRFVDTMSCEANNGGGGRATCSSTNMSNRLLSVTKNEKKSLEYQRDGLQFNAPYAISDKPGMGT